MPNVAGVACWPTWIMAEGTSAASGTIAPASSSAPCRAGRHSAASAATATTASMTMTLPAIAIAGLSNALPAVMVCDVPVAVATRVKLSQDGAKAAAAPIAASTSSASGPAWRRPGRAGPAQRARAPRSTGAPRRPGPGGRSLRLQLARPLPVCLERERRSRGTRGPAEQAHHQAGAERDAAGDNLAEVGEKQPECHRAQSEPEQRAEPRCVARPRDAERDERRGHHPADHVAQVWYHLVPLGEQALTALVAGEQAGQPEDHAEDE